MDITVTKEQAKVPVTILSVAGHLDRQSYQQLIDAARSEYDAGARAMLLDLTDLTYISSAGVIALYTIALMLRGEAVPDPEQGWHAYKSMDRGREETVQKNIKLLNVRPDVNNVLEMVGFAAFFQMFKDRKKAMNSF